MEFCYNIITKGEVTKKIPESRFEKMTNYAGKC